MMMAEGSTHLYYWKLVLVLVLGGCFFLYFTYPDDLYYFIAFIVGYLSGYLIDPDLDHTSDYSAKIRWKRTLIGYPVYLWWKVYSYTVASALGGHRAFLNHVPILSTGIRVIWLFTPIVFICYLAGFSGLFFDGWLEMFICAFVGLSLSDLVHYVLDYI